MQRFKRNKTGIKNQTRSPSIGASVEGIVCVMEVETAADTATGSPRATICPSTSERSMSHVKNSVLVAVALVSCLAAQEVRGQEIVVTLLGTGSLIPEVDRFGPSIMIQAGSQTLLFDVGRGTHQRRA